MEWSKLKETVYHFEGAWLDLYVLDTDRSDWQKWIEYINRRYSITFMSGEEKIIKGQIEYESVLKYWDGDSDYLRGATFSISGIDMNCHFFTEQEIENDVDPRNIKNVEDHRALMSYMIKVSKLLNKPMIITPENISSIVLIKCFQGKVEINESHWS